MLGSAVTSIRIDPHRLMGMLLWGMVCGAGLGGVWDVFRITRVFLGIHYPSRSVTRWYETPLPLLHRPVSRPHPASKRLLPPHLLRGAVIFVEDALFGVLCGCTMTLLIYFTNDGIFRAMAPLGMLSGFLIYYHTLGRVILSLSQIVVFLLRAARCYLVAALLLPPRLLLRLWRRTLGALWRKQREGARLRRAARYHDRMLRELTARAERGWLTEAAKTSKRKGERHHATKKTDQENDNGIAERQNVFDADRSLCHHLFCNQNDAEQQAEAGERSAAKADRRGKTKSV